MSVAAASFLGSFTWTGFDRLPRARRFSASVTSAIMRSYASRAVSPKLKTTCFSSNSPYAGRSF